MLNLIDRQDLASAVRQLRGNRGIEECARRAGLRPRSWRSYEAGDTLPQPRSLRRLAEGLEVTVVELQDAIWHAWSARVHVTAASETGTSPGVILVVASGPVIYRSI